MKVGDRVIGNKKADVYGITKKGWVGVVVEFDGSEVVLRSIDGDGDYYVKPEYFFVCSFNGYYKLLK